MASLSTYTLTPSMPNIKTGMPRSFGGSTTNIKFVSPKSSTIQASVFKQPKSQMKSISSLNANTEEMQAEIIKKTKERELRMLTGILRNEELKKKKEEEK